MAITSVHEWIGDEQGADMEETAYQAGCAFAREVMTSRLKAIDDDLFTRKPLGFRVMGSHDRTLMTRFGE